MGNTHAPQIPTKNARRRGSALVEFAFVAIAFLSFLFGVIAFCRAVYTYEYVDFAARKGARWAIVRGAGCATTGSPQGPNPSCWCHYPPSTGTSCASTGATATDIQSYVQNLDLPGVSASHIAINTTSTFVWPGPATGNGCTTTNSLGVYNTRGCPVKVQVSYSFTLQVAFLPPLSIPMQAESQMVISQ